ncbi:hypothetical protein NW768_003998 [Fusarium equiseti]|uniref:Uncharacterized protein n=1 Tax=Fusarium equiseti TaxID=61235 RepID=A0ABQ8RJ80_FUSEQ|nr:hypothetical protein NW768_003998 [Fusarium equiseti]
MSTSRLILRPVVRMPSQIRLASTNPTHVHPDGNLGGPGGQQPPPQAPGGPEAIKRNWMPIAAAAGVLAGGVWIMLPRRGNPPEKTLQHGIAASYQEIKDGKSAESMKELSGRKSGMGGFRAE